MIACMADIVTLTINPAVDVAYDVDKVVPTEKLRSTSEHYNAGGGGINVARVIARFGGSVRAHYLSGGATGSALDSLIDRLSLPVHRIAIAGDTRVSAAVFERSTGRQYRFVPKGPTLSQIEWEACLAALGDVKCDWLVASGSLPEGVPTDFYARVAAIAKRIGARLVLDTSGPALKAAVEGGGVFLLKPNRNELGALVGKPLATDEALGAAAMDLVERKRVSMVAVTMGADGALLVLPDGTFRIPALAVESLSSVGAGDSFLGAMVFALSQRRGDIDAFRFGVAAGAAAVLSEGADLCHPNAVERLLPLVEHPTRKELA
jgi:6-phosphofructokinase 2